jgi:hypothetical protein
MSSWSSTSGAKHGGAMEALGYLPKSSQAVLDSVHGC